MFDRNAETRRTQPIDPISELLTGMRLRGASYGRIRLSPPFGMRFPPAPEARFHFIAQGHLFLRSPDGEMRELSRGDAVLLPRGDEHALVSAYGVPVRDISSFDAAQLCPNVCAIQECDETTCRTLDALVFTGRMEFELDTLHPLTGLMPAIMSVGALLDQQPEIMPLLSAMEREAATERAGSVTILARLAEVVAASIVRGWVEYGCGHASGWIDALRDPKLGRVIAALHQDPGRAWTIAEMAAEMGSSRSVFAKRFVEVTGVTPQRYVTALRMRLAEQWFRRDNVPVDKVARTLGFGSQAAFARAFKRITGEPPGKTRAAGKRLPGGIPEGL